VCLSVQVVESISARFQTHTVAVTFAAITEDQAFSETPNKDVGGAKKSEQHRHVSYSARIFLFFLEEKRENLIHFRFDLRTKYMYACMCV
jgi:hypothetical protein